MTAKELRAEAREWRRMAEYPGDPLPPAHALRTAMIMRAIQHVFADESSGYRDENADVLAKLLFALECEDEAREAA